MVQAEAMAAMSRAAKKRAKKRQKRDQQKQQDQQHGAAHDDDEDDDDDERMKKRKKKEVAEIKSTNEKNDNNNQRSKGKNQDKKQREDVKRQRNDRKHDDDNEDEEEEETFDKNNAFVEDDEESFHEDYDHSSDEKDSDDGDDKKKEEEEEDDDDGEQEVKMKSPAKAGGILNEIRCEKLVDLLLLAKEDKNVNGQKNSGKSSMHDVRDDVDDDEFRSMTVHERATTVLSFLLQPAGLTVSQFYETYWEKKPLLVQNKKTGSGDNDSFSRLDGFLSKASIQKLTSSSSSSSSASKKLYYGQDLNVTRYEKDSNGVKRRVTLDLKKTKSTASKKGKGEGSDDDEKSSDKGDGEEDTIYLPVDHDLLWDQFHKEGCTIRLLCPHKHSPSIHALLCLLEHEWGCMVGANAYLTPPNQSQGFAPHYDDIEAFCLQLEGRKRWKVYAPLQKAERLPRVSSEDYVEDDLRDVEPIMDIILEPGDMLYMPRGWIHQAITLPVKSERQEQQHSLHLTVSAMQQWAWVDLMEILLPEAIESLASSDSTILRSGLPIRFLDCMGAMHDNDAEKMPEIIRNQLVKLSGSGETTDDNDFRSNEELDSERSLSKLLQLREDFRVQAKKKIARVAKEAVDLLDAACDQIGKRFLSDRLPPALTQAEQALTCKGKSKSFPIHPNMLVRLVRPGIARLVLEDQKAVVYHCADNSCAYHEIALSPLEFEMDDAPSIEQILTTSEPHWICVGDLFHDSVEDKIAVTQALYDEGILAIRD